LLIAFLTVTQPACASDDETHHAAIIGTWKSDAARTIDAMDEVDGIAQEVRAAFADDYFGHLVIEYRVDTVRAYFDNSEYDSGYQPYDVVEVGDDYVVTREFNEVLGVYEESTTYIDPPCIYGISSSYGFREYYCPLPVEGSDRGNLLISD
jgi:hypothetical protein